MDNNIWEERFSTLSLFHSKYSRRPYTHEKFEGIKIGKWLNKQRNQTDEEKRKRIEDIFPKFYTDRKNIIWEEAFQILQRYYAQKGYSPTSEDEFEDFNIGKWLNDQRYNIRYLNATGDPKGITREQARRLLQFDPKIIQKGKVNI